ncbi:MAG TPA: ABC transporter ATP-binding protein [Burkholderiaceae bacterium]|nr:ABC transporter ATP-binding protein [Burkholderiaceae bacterium]
MIAAMRTVEGPDPQVLVQADRLTKVFGEGALATTVLRDVTLTIRAGEFVLLMGPSGSGKSTLLCLLSGLLLPSSGTVTLCGAPLSRLSGGDAAEVRRRHLGFIFQSYNLFPALTALDNVGEVLVLKGVARSRATELATEALTRVGLGHRLRLRPADLSGGERQRVAIARALAGDPSLIFGDEPTAALDRHTGMEIVGLLKEQVNGRRGVLLVTHDHRLVPYADRIIEIDDGQLIGNRTVDPSERNVEVLR